MSREAMQMALEALEKLAKVEHPSHKVTYKKPMNGHIVTIYPHKIAVDAITLLRQALAEPEPRNQCAETCERATLCAICAGGITEQEPVAWMGIDIEGNPNKFRLNFFGGAIPLFVRNEDRTTIADNEKDGSPCPEFWDWLPRAYNFDGDGVFTKYNMEVAFLAGKQFADADDTSQERVDETVKCKHEPVAEIQAEDMGKPFNAIRVTVHFYAEVPAVGTKLYKAPPKRELTCVCGAVWEGEMMVHPPRKAAEWFDCTDAQLMDEVRRRGFVIRDAQIDPVKREWVGLTEEEIQDLSHLSQKIDQSNETWFDRLGFARAIETKLREKNT